MLTSSLQAQLSPLADTIHSSRKRWWARVSAARNQTPSALPNKITKRGRQRQPTALDNLTHRLRWKIDHVAARSALLVRFGFAPYDFTLDEHVGASLRPPRGTETFTNQLGNALRETEGRLNRRERAVKAVDVEYLGRLKDLRDRAKGLERALKVKKGEHWCVGEVEQWEGRELRLFSEGMEGTMQGMRRSEVLLAGKWRRDVLDVMREMSELGVEVAGGRQKMITEFFERL
ncbi:hypothetical protein PRZ48_002594 [Zasmidium cellare]|uniref:Uncharacterized protein n=1 Tax=Zasmidium cellare TaxID=395010 RepID=A0ABR0ETZ6_ZASCE|nr:hypothetical protein PRZ48_002594 [Zasmidium cellare]